jgi:5-hydroxyisourate hydrolase
MPVKLSTHVLDTAHGRPAAGMQIELWSITGDGRRRIKTERTNRDGRTDQPLLAEGELKAGVYELIFFVRDYFQSIPERPEITFLDQVPVRFELADASASYHVPLLVSPWAYSTYRGS